MTVDQPWEYVAVLHHVRIDRVRYVRYEGARRGELVDDQGREYYYCDGKVMCKTYAEAYARIVRYWGLERANVEELQRKVAEHMAEIKTATAALALLPVDQPEGVI